MKDEIPLYITQVKFQPQLSLTLRDDDNEFDMSYDLYQSVRHHTTTTHTPSTNCPK